MFITTSAQDMNNNNLQEPGMTPYTFLFAATNQPYDRPHPPGKADTVCDLCFKHFSTFSSLFKHKANLCYIDLSGLLPPLSNVILVHLILSYFISSYHSIKSLLCHITKVSIGELITPIKICFAEGHLQWIDDTIKSLGMEVKRAESDDEVSGAYLYVVVDEVRFSILLHLPCKVTTSLPTYSLPISSAFYFLYSFVIIEYG